MLHPTIQKESLTGLIRADVWSLCMTLFVILKPEMQYPYELESWEVLRNAYLLKRFWCRSMKAVQSLR